VVKRKAKKRSVTGIEPNDKETPRTVWLRLRSGCERRTRAIRALSVAARYRWGELRAGGGSLDTSLLEAPPTETRTEIKRLANEGAWTR